MVLYKVIFSLECLRLNLELQTGQALSSNYIPSLLQAYFVAYTPKARFQVGLLVYLLFLPLPPCLWMLHTHLAVVLLGAAHGIVVLMCAPARAHTSPPPLHSWPLYLLNCCAYTGWWCSYAHFVVVEPGKLHTVRLLCLHFTYVTLGIHPCDHTMLRQVL